MKKKKEKKEREQTYRYVGRVNCHLDDDLLYEAEVEGLQLRTCPDLEDPFDRDPSVHGCDFYSNGTSNTLKPRESNGQFIIVGTRNSWNLVRDPASPGRHHRLIYR